MCNRRKCFFSSSDILNEALRRLLLWTLACHRIIAGSLELDSGICFEYIIKCKTALCQALHRLLIHTITLERSTASFSTKDTTPTLLNTLLVRNHKILEARLLLLLLTLHISLSILPHTPEAIGTKTGEYYTHSVVSFARATALLKRGRRSFTSSD